MGLMLSFFRAYRWQTVLMLIALLLSGAAEGIGLSALLPLMNIALGAEAADLMPGGAGNSEFEEVVLGLLAKANIAPTMANMLLIIIGGIAFKSFFLLILAPFLWEAVEATQ